MVEHVASFGWTLFFFCFFLLYLPRSPDLVSSVCAGERWTAWVLFS